MQMNAKLALTLVCLAVGTLGELPPSYPAINVSGVDGRPVRYPLIGLGTWLYNESTAEAALGSALRLGYRHVDTATSYENQVGVGAALAKSALARHEYFVTTKIPPGLNRSATIAALDRSLGELGLEYVDMMLLHFPSKDAAARKAQWTALETWALSGKARAIGVSHYCESHMQEVLSYAKVPIALAQNQYHVGMFHDTQPQLHGKAFAEANNIQFMAYSTLCGPCPAPHNRELIDGALVSRIGKSHNKTGAQVALRWVVQQGIPVIPKSSNPEHLRSNFDLFSFELSEEEVRALNEQTSPPETGTAAHPDDAQDCPAK